MPVESFQGFKGMRTIVPKGKYQSLSKHRAFGVDGEVSCSYLLFS